MLNQSLESRLAPLRAATAQRLPRLTALNERLFAELRETVAKSALEVGDHAPDIELWVAQDGSKLRLSWLLDNGPVALAFYRGHWCPYSNVQAHALQQAYPAIAAGGGQLLLVGPEVRPNARKMADKWSASFPVIADADGQDMDAFGLNFEIPDYLRADYAHVGLPELNPATGWRLPVCATYVVDQMCVIRLRHLDVDYTRRLEPADVVAAVRKLRRSIAA
jgi:peroxiredoxin